jgi:hypothetical protein
MKTIYQVMAQPGLWADCTASEYAAHQAEGCEVRRVSLFAQYRITARTWYGQNGGEFRAELSNVETGFKLVGVSGTTWGSDAWAYAMRDAMHAQHPEKFPPHNGGHPTIYFRDVCNVDYQHNEVQRKRDL